MYISQKGNLSCYNGTHIGPIIEWGFDCGNHGDHPINRYKAADSEGFSFALSHALQFMKQAGAVWVANLVTALGEQYK